MKLACPVRLAVAVVVLATAVPVAAQEPEAQIRAAVNIVRLRVAVTHSSGGDIPPLSAEDFRVFDNGIEQQVRLLRRPEDTPLRVALVIDASPSLRPWWLTVQRTAVTFLAKLSDRACPYVLPFAASIGPGRWGRYNANSWRAFLAEPKLGGETVLHDALIIALEQLIEADEVAIAASQPDRAFELDLSADDAAAVVTHRSMRAQMMRIAAEIVRLTPPTHFGNCDLRFTTSEAGDEDVTQLPSDEAVKAVLLVTDGADTASIATAADVVNAAQVSNVPVFPVVVGAAANDRELATLLARIARDTGGLTVDNVSVQELGSAYNQVLAYLRSSYVLVYDANDGDGTAPADGWHDVRVELRRPLLDTIVRPGYYR